MRVKIHIQKHRYAENSGEVLILTTLSTVPTAFYLSFSVSYIIYAFMKLLTAVLGKLSFFMYSSDSPSILLATLDKIPYFFLFN